MRSSPETTEFLTTAQAARFLGLSKSLLEKARHYRRRDYPPYVRFGRSIRYAASDLRDWATVRKIG